MDKMTIPIINQIENMVQDIPGWSPIDQLYSLFNLVYLTSDTPGDIIEIGSWCGRSASVLATAARLIGSTKVYCIDLFPEKNDWKQNDDGSYSFEVQIEGKVYGGYKDQTVWREPFEKDIAPLYEKHNGILDIFTEAIGRLDLQDIVEAHRGDSTVCKRLTERNVWCKLAFLDGDHSYASVCQDIRNVEDILLDGGWICFDDAFSSYGGVNQAINELIINNPMYELQQQMTRKFFVARRKLGLLAARTVSSQGEV
ncbi:MAG: class I SAM-dependent methyltransferase [Methanosarcinales archaeon]|nr:MAG: class I SAM-dependent methyltransferase [Methanosarcinales archaeon]